MVYFLNSDELIGTDKEICLSFYDKKNEVRFPHYHNFYEITLVTKGSYKIIINESELTLKEGSMILLRPFDIHSKIFDGDCHSTNLAFLTKVMEDLILYLGDCFDSSLINGDITPNIMSLSKSDMYVLKERFDKLNVLSSDDEKLTRLELRVLLIDLVTRFYATKISAKKSFPFWFENLISEMHKKQNFSQGMSAILQISGKSHSHICSSFKKYLNVTPIDFLNDIKLTYSVSLLKNTDLGISEISLESGFETLSHYYHLFQSKYFMTPKKFRSENSQYKKGNI